MPELRKDPILGRWIIISQEREKRPTDFIIETDAVRGGFCPLCPGNENTTPSEVLAYGRNHQVPNTPGWTLRVVPNKYPALVIEGDLDKQGEGPYDKMNGIGAHEVIVETPKHNEPFSQMEPERLANVFFAYRDRTVDLGRDPRFQYVIVFKNFGRAAGASLEHSHSQLIALPILPRMIVSELEGSFSYYKYKDRCIFCDIIRHEVQYGNRLVCANADFLCITPFAPRSPFEMWVLPKRHSSCFSSMADPLFISLSRLFSEVMRRLDACIPNVPFNFVLHTGPLRSQPLDHFHWHFEIMPKLTMMAGFEWGSGFYINPTPPEDAAQYLREINLSSPPPVNERRV